MSETEMGRCVCGWTGPASEATDHQMYSGPERAACPQWRAAFQADSADPMLNPQHNWLAHQQDGPEQGEVEQAEPEHDLAPVTTEIERYAPQLPATLDGLSYDDLIALGNYVQRHLSGLKWALGDLAAHVETSYGEGKLQDYASDLGIEYATLRRYRDVARAWPQSAPRGAHSFSVLREFAAQPDRVEMLARFDESGGRTVAQARTFVDRWLDARQQQPLPGPASPADSPATPRHTDAQRPASEARQPDSQRQADREHRQPRERLPRPQRGDGYRQACWALRTALSTMARNMGGADVDEFPRMGMFRDQAIDLVSMIRCLLIYTNQEPLPADVIAPLGDDWLPLPEPARQPPPPPEPGRDPLAGLDAAMGP